MFIEQLFCCNDKCVKDMCIGMNPCTHSCAFHCNAHCVIAVTRSPFHSCATQDDHSLPSGVYSMFNFCLNLIYYCFTQSYGSFCLLILMFFQSVRLTLSHFDHPCVWFFFNAIIQSIQHFNQQPPLLNQSNKQTLHSEFREHPRKKRGKKKQ